MLFEKGVPHEVEMAGLLEPKDLKKANPVGKVPALRSRTGASWLPPARGRKR